MPSKSTYFFLGLSLVFTIGANSAVAEGCRSAPREIGPLGAMTGSSLKTSNSKILSLVLPAAKEFDQVLETRLTPKGETVVIYNSSKEEIDPLPRIALLSHTSGRISVVLDRKLDGPGGMSRFLLACEFQESAHQSAVAIAFSTSGDGAATSFRIFKWDGTAYKTAFEADTIQGENLAWQKHTFRLDG